MHEISIWYNRKIELNIWYRNLCLQLQRSDVSCSSWPGLHTLQQGFWPTTPYWSSPAFSGFEAVAGQHRILAASIDFLLGSGLETGYWLGHSRTLKCFLWSHSLVALAVCSGSLSCWKTQPRPIINSLTDGRRLLAKIWRYMDPYIFPSIRCSRPVPFAEKHPQSMMLPPPMLHGWDGVLGIVLILLPPNTASGVYTKRLYFGLMTFSHASSGSSRWSLANFRRAWTCAGLSRGTLRVFDYHAHLVSKAVNPHHLLSDGAAITTQSRSSLTS